MDALAERVIELLIPRLQQMLESVVAGISVTQVIGASSAAPAFVEGRMQVTDDVPVFIPSKIGRDDMRSTVDVSATKGADDGGVTDAVAALKAARKEKS